MPAGENCPDERWMQRAIELAKKGQGLVEPNPMVGCVIVLDNEKVGEGYHRLFGGPHAEVEAIASTKQRSLHGATLYVTLEPCCHTGKTPPCTEAVMNAGIKRVVVGTIDPNPKVAGQGIKQLQDAGIKVDVGVCEQTCKRLIAPFAKTVSNGTPWVIAKWAMSLDGKIATGTGDSKWISGEASRRFVHQLRAQVDAIMVGSRTVIADDPMLTARDVDVKRTATRVVVDSRLVIPADSQLVKSAGDIPVIIATGPGADHDKVHQLVDAGCDVWINETTEQDNRLLPMLQMLCQRGMTNVLVEGGGGLLGALFDARLVDEVHCFVAPKLIGGAGAPGPVGGAGLKKIQDALTLIDVQSQTLENDIHIRGLVR